MRAKQQVNYTAYGLKIAAISSRKLGDIAEGSLKNNYGYQGDYSEFDEDLGYNEFALRNYDPQIGRFIQQDPYQQFSSPYTGMGNDPANNVDPTGGWLEAITGTTNVFINAAATTITGALIGGIVDFATGGDGRGALIGAGIGLGVGLASGINWGGMSVGTIASAGANVASTATTLANGANASNQVVNYPPSGGSGNPQPTPLEIEYRKLVETGQYPAAINTVINAYPTEMNTDKRYYKFDFKPDDPQHQFTTQAIRDGTGPTKTGWSLITFGIQDLLCLNFNAIARNIYHELWHVKQQHGIQGVKLMSFHNEKEFDANYRTLTNTILPKYTPQQAVQYKNAIKFYYDNLETQELKDKYKAQYESLFPPK